MPTTFTLLVAANVAAWAWAAFALSGYPTLWSLAALAYTFGMRHAFDADHIAAIDNVVRKLMQHGRSASSVGLFFSLGHSTVVFLACVAVAAAASPLRHRFEAFQEMGGILGTAMSALFLLIIGVANLFVLLKVWNKFRRLRPGRRPVNESLDGILLGGTARLCQPLFRLVSRSWHMYPVGLLFGLGFDTATEVGLLGISAQGSMRGASLGSILVFPALFTAAMSLLDTSDSMLMTRAYGWAFVHPLRRLWYNLTVTAASVIVALGIGGVEALALIAERYALHGAFWRAATGLNDDLSRVGYLVVGVFLASWILSIAIYKAKQYHRVPTG